MNQGQLVFAQLMQHLPLTTLRFDRPLPTFRVSALA
jgi:hypothetical protein